MGQTGKIRYSFERVERKYFLTPQQQTALLSSIGERLVPDAYGRYTVTNLYYDTADWALIRASLEKPVYKEKLRARCYDVPRDGDSVFLELKKKFDGVVYKRRISLPAADVAPFLAGELPDPSDGQIARELLWTARSRRVAPRVFLAYDRTAFAGREDDALRITFDTGLRYRTVALDLRRGDAGQPILPPGSPYAGQILMELKVPGACPLWLAHALSAVGARPASFSKYGTVFTEHILPAVQADRYSKEAVIHA